jgi:hypothetical protein
MFEGRRNGGWGKFRLFRKHEILVALVFVYKKREKEKQERRAGALLGREKNLIAPM